MHIHSYILYIIFYFRYMFFIYIYISIIYIIFHYTYTYFCIYVIYVSMFFLAQCVTHSSWPWISSDSMSVDIWLCVKQNSINYGVIIVVPSLNSDVDLCACPPWQVRGEYQFFTFESYDLSLSSFVTTFQCENTREGAMWCAFRLEPVVDHFHQEYFFNVQVRLCSGHPEVEGRLGQKDFRIPDVEGTTMVYNRCVSNLSKIPLQPTRTYLLGANTLRMTLFGMSRLCWKIFDQMITVWFWMLEKISQIWYVRLVAWPDTQIFPLQRWFNGHFEHQKLHHWLRWFCSICLPWCGRCYFPV